MKIYNTNKIPLRKDKKLPSSTRYPKNVIRKEKVSSKVRNPRRSEKPKVEGIYYVKRHMPYCYVSHDLII